MKTTHQLVYDETVNGKTTRYRCCIEVEFDAQKFSQGSRAIRASRAKTRKSVSGPVTVRCLSKEEVALPTAKEGD